jgi:hypothetical protein
LEGRNALFYFASYSISNSSSVGANLLKVSFNPFFKENGISLAFLAFSGGFFYMIYYWFLVKKIV